MKTSVLIRFSRVALASAAGIVLTIAIAGAQQPQPTAPSRQEARDTAKEKIQSARDSKQGGREGVRDAREGARDTAREDRQATRDTRETARDTAREGRQTIREARRDVRAARREFIASRIRSGDLGLWLRRAADRLQITDVANRGVIANTGLKEGDEIISINGQPVLSERQFIDLLFADHENNKAAQVVVRRGGKEQTISIQPKLFVAEHLADDNRLAEYGLILDESNPNQVKVQAVVPRSPAFYAGVRSGDQIAAFGGERINALTDLVRSLAGITAGGPTSVEVNRNNQSRQLEIDIPGETTAEEPRTALRPTLPDSSAGTPESLRQDKATPRPLPDTAPRPLPQ